MVQTVLYVTDDSCISLDKFVLLKKSQQYLFPFGVGWGGGWGFPKPGSKKGVLLEQIPEAVEQSFLLLGDLLLQDLLHFHNC